MAREMPVDWEIYASFLIYCRKRYRRGPEIADAWLHEYCEKIYERGFRWITAFTWAYEKKGFYREFVPYLPGSFEKNKMYWKYMRTYLDITKKHHLPTKWIVYSKYHWWLFEEAGLPVLEGKAAELLLKHVKKLYRMMRKRFKNKPLRIQFYNEPTHGDHSWGLSLIHLSERIYDVVRSVAGVQVEGCDCDKTLTDYGRLENPGVRLTIVKKDGRVIDTLEDLSALDDIVADPNNFSVTVTDTWGREEFDHLATLKENSMNQWTMDAKLAYVGGWRYFLLSQDGNSLGSGHRVPGFPPDKGWCNLSNDELREFLQKAFAHRLVKRAGFFPMEIFELAPNGELLENPDLIDWERAWIPMEEWNKYLDYHDSHM